eukprot:1937763-Pyramimonas_sp.AAC.1
MSSLSGFRIAARSRSPRADRVRQERIYPGCEPIARVERENIPVRVGMLTWRCASRQVSLVDVSLWGNQEVADWIAEIGYPQYRCKPRVP